MVSDANGGAHKIYNAITHAMLCKRANKKYLCTDTGAGYNGKMFSMVAKEFSWVLKYSWAHVILKGKTKLMQ